MMKLFNNQSISCLIKILLFMLNAYSRMYAQGGHEYNMEYFNKNHELSQNYIMDIHQDRTGFLWIATRDGLNRYDGYNVRTFRFSNKDTNSICGNFIECIYEDSNGNLWFGTYEGFSRYNPLTEEFTNYTNDLTDSISIRNKSVNEIIEDDYGIIWLGTSKGLYTFDPVTNIYRSYLPDAEDPNSIPFEQCEILFKDDDGDIWVSPEEDFISYYDRENDNFINITSREYSFLHSTFSTFVDGGKNYIYINTSQQNVYRMHKKDRTLSDVSGALSLKNRNCFLTRCSNGQLYLVDGNNISEVKFDPFIKKTVIGDDYKYPVSFSFTFIEKTRDGIIWAGTNGQGLYKFIPRLTKFRTIKYSNRGEHKLSVKSIRAICLDSDDNLWIGGYTTLNVIPNFKEQLKNRKASDLEIFNIDIFNSMNVYSIIEDPFDKDILWIGIEFYSLYKYNKKTGKTVKAEELPGIKNVLTGNRFYELIIDNKKKLWVGTNTGLFCIDLKSKKVTPYYNSEDNPNSISKGNAWTLMEDSSGLIWLGTNLGGVSVIDPETGDIKRFESVEGDSSTLSSNYVQVIHEDRNNNIWIGTQSGLSFYNRNSNSFTNFTDKDGLANDCIYSVLEDNESNLWLSTNKGIIEHDVINNIFNNYDVTYGLQNNEFNRAAYFKDNDGIIYFGGISGITFFNPEEIKQNEYVPNFGIVNFQKFNTDVKPEKSITFAGQMDLQYNDYSFSFEFTSFDFSYPEKNMFSYKMEGFDKDWITTSADKRFAVYTSVEPGNYIFRLKASNSDGVWNENSKSINVNIAPPYWETWWFRISSLLIVAGIMFLLYRSRINRLREEKNIQQDLTKKLINNQEDERKYISAELHDGLGQSLLIVKNNLVLAKRDKNYEEQIEDSIGILSKSISEVSNISHVLHPSELDQLGLVLAVGEMVDRIERASDLKIDCDINPVEELFPKENQITIFRVIQEALNNILKHAGASKVDIYTIAEDNEIRLHIKDNGIGFNASKKKTKGDRPHFGLAGMKERTRMLDGKLKIISEKGEGTEIIITFNKIPR